MTRHAAHAGAAVAGGGDTIVALATPPGRSAIAVVRLTGPQSHDVAGRVTSPWPLPARVARLCTLRDPASGMLIDRGIVTAYPAGGSYTGEPMVEMATHGGRFVPARAMSALIRAGAREALPGEFTRRAVLNCKLELVRTEAVWDLVDARSRLMRQTALAPLDGGLSRRIEELRHALIETEALIAYDIDFPEEDDGPIEQARILASCDAVLGQLEALISTAPAGELVREGAITVLAGAPNAGKSSLYNALLGEARAIVTEIPGTTRDALEATIDADGWPLRLVDTAGLRESTDILERMGIEASARYLARAHVVLACGETLDAVATVAAQVGGATPAPIIGVHTKHDLVTTSDQTPRTPIVSNSIKSLPHQHSDHSTSIDTPRHEKRPPDLRCTPLVPQSLQNTTHYHRIAPNHLVPHRFHEGRLGGDELVSTRSESGTNPPPLPVGVETSLTVIAVSAVTGEGLAELRQAVVAVLRRQYGALSV